MDKVFFSAEFQKIYDAHKRTFNAAQADRYFNRFKSLTEEQFTTLVDTAEATI
jgi:hypothetical protein